MRPVLPAGNRRIHRSADGSAQQERGTLRGGHFICHTRTFPRNRNAALFDERKRQLLKRRSIGDRAGNRRVIFLAMRRHPCGIFRTGMQRRCLQSEPIERVFQKRYALLERIQKSHLQIRTQNEQRHARKARARTDVDDLCAVRKQPMRQRRGTVQIVTVYALYALGPASALAILLARCLLGAMFAGNASALLFSLMGGGLSMLVMIVLRHLPRLSIYGVSIGGAAAHNIGQIGAAMIVLGGTAVLGYLPVLLAVSLLTGTLTGFVAGLLFRAMKNVKLSR